MLKRFSRFVGWFKPTGDVLAPAKSLLYNCKGQAENPHWHSKGLVGTDFRSRQTLLMSHIWVVHKRLIGEGSKGLLVQEAFFDELWKVTSSNIRNQGVSEMMVNKYLEEVQKYSFRVCVELDQALTYAPNEDEVLDSMAGTIWRCIYLRKDEIDPKYPIEFARYIRNEHLSLMKLPQDAIFGGRLQWGELPEWGSIITSSRILSTSKNKEKEQPVVVQAVAVSVGEWKEAMTEGGKKYYWNTVTRESRWEKPK